MEKKFSTKKSKNQNKDLEYIKMYFFDLKLYEIVKKIDNDIKG